MMTPALKRRGLSLEDMMQKDPFAAHEGVDVDAMLETEDAPKKVKKVEKAILVRWAYSMRGTAAGKTRYRDDTFYCTPEEAAAAGDNVEIL